MNEVYTFIEAEKTTHGVAFLCRLLKVARSSFYAWLAGAKGRATRQAADDALAHEITVLHRPDRLDRVRQTLQPVANQHEDIFNSAILQLGEDLQPVFGTLAAVAGPDPEDVASALDRDGHRNIDGPVGYLAIANLHVDGVHEDHGVDAIERARLPLRHALYHLVRDRGDGLLGHLGAVHLGQMRRYLFRG